MGQSLRILSGNLLNGRACIDSLIDMAHALAVDVMALQEVAPEHAEALAGVLPHGEIRPEYNYVGMALTTRRPCALEIVPMTWGFGQTVRLEPEHWSGLSRSIEISNFHLAAPHMLMPAPGLYLRWRQMRELMAYLEAGAGDAQRGVDVAEAEGAERVEGAAIGDVEGIAGRAGSAGETEGVGRNARERSAPARVLVGDFNSTTYWPAYRRIASQFTDAAVAVATRRGRPLRSTWGPWPGAPKLFRIDHGFVRGVEVEEFRVLEMRGSDHSAFVMDLALD